MVDILSFIFNTIIIQKYKHFKIFYEYLRDGLVEKSTQYTLAEDPSLGLSIAMVDVSESSAKDLMTLALGHIHTNAQSPSPF